MRAFDMLYYIVFWIFVKLFLYIFIYLLYIFPFFYNLLFSHPSFSSSTTHLSNCFLGFITKLSFFILHLRSTFFYAWNLVLYMLFLVSVVVIVYSFLPFLLFIKKLTQQEFAELVNIPQPSISAYENDRNSPNMDVLINILLVSLFTEMISSIH